LLYAHLAVLTSVETQESIQPLFLHQRYAFHRYWRSEQLLAIRSGICFSTHDATRFRFPTKGHNVAALDEPND
jgi:hypothetical protein